MDEDAQLVELAAQGDTLAFNALMQRHYSKVYGQALRMMKSEEEAKDVAQLAWIKAWKKLTSFRGDSAFTSWMYRITTFTALDAIRRRDSRRESHFDTEILENLAAEDSSAIASPSQIRTLERKEAQHHFNRALDALPEAQKTALTLREVEGLSYEEIAVAMKCKIGTVMSRLFNARKAIQKTLAQTLN